MTNVGIKFQNRYIKFPVIGFIRTKNKNVDKLIEGKILSVTVSCRANRWFASILTQQETSVEKITIDEMVGVDLGIKTFATLSDGTKIEPCRALKKHKDKLKREQRKLSKKQKGSKIDRSNE